MRMRMVFLLIGGLSATALLAQTDRATVRGTVTDPSGASVPGVLITVTDVATNIEVRRLESDAVGNYEVPELRPGRYRIKADLQGFRSFVAEDVLLEGGQVRRVNISLEIGKMTETVTVEAGASLIQTETGTISAELDKTKFLDRPFVDYYPSPLSLLGTTSGIQGNQWALVMTGITSRNQQDWSFDGISNETTPDQLDHPVFFETVQVDPVRTGADSGRATGFTMISKRGGNEFHGSVSYIHINAGLNAREYFTPQRAPYIQHEGVAEASGPIFRDRTFFYAAWFQQRIPLGNWVNASVPTLKMRDGDLSQFAKAVKDPLTGNPFPNNVIPKERFNPVSVKALNLYYPKPNQGGPDLMTNNHGFYFPYSVQNYLGDWPFFRIDHQVGKNNSFYWRWMQRKTPYIMSGSFDWATRTRLRDHRNWVASDTHVFSPRLLNTFTFSRQTDIIWDGLELKGIKPLRGAAAVEAIGLQGVNPRGYTTVGFPQMSISGLTTLSGATGGIDDVTVDDSVHTIIDTVSWTKSRHVLKFGMEHRRFSWHNPTISSQVFGSFSFDGSYTGNAFADFLLGVPQQSVRLDPLANRFSRNTQLAFYVNDSFKATKRLTIDVGLRWDRYGMPTYKDGLMWNWDPATGNVIVTEAGASRVHPLYPKTIQIVTGQVVPDPDTKNIRPRLGVAYRLTDKSVVRGSYGEFTESWAHNELLLGAGPYQLGEDYRNVITQGKPMFQFPNPFPLDLSKATVPSQSVQSIPLKTDHGVLRRFNVTLERQMFNLGFRVSYIGTRGSGLNYNLNTNKPQPSTTPFKASMRPFPQFVNTTVRQTSGLWHYDSLQVEVQKRAGAFTFNSNWTWANNLTNYANTANPYNVTGQWARNSSDRQHYWSTSMMWNVPVGKGKRYLAAAPAFVDHVLGGWQMQFIAVFATGQYFSPSFSGSDPSNTGTVGGLPDRIADGNKSPSQRSRTQWFDPSAFTVPPTGRFGNCGVNVLEGQGINVQHLSFSKSFSIKERFRIALAGQISNLFNRPHFSLPRSNISAADPGMFTSTPIQFAAEKDAFRMAAVKLRLSF